MRREIALSVRMSVMFPFWWLPGAATAHLLRGARTAPFERHITITIIERPHAPTRRSRTAALLGTGVLAAAMTLGVGSASADTVDPTPIPVGSAPLGVAITPDGARAYVANWLAGTVSVINTSDNTVTAIDLPVGGSPAGIAITPDGLRAYVTNHGSTTVSVITIDIAPTLTGVPPAGVVGQPYTHAFTVTGQPAPTVTAVGALPAGLTLTEAGVLSGTPTEAGTFAVAFTASNGIGIPATLDTTLTINETPEPPVTGSLGSLGNFGS